MYSLSLISFNLKLFPLLLSLCDRKVSIILITHLTHWKAATMSLLLSLLQDEQTWLSQPFCVEEVLQPSDYFCGLLCTCSNRSITFFYWGPQSWIQDSWADWGLWVSTLHSRLIHCNPLCLSPGAAVWLRLSLLLFLIGCSSHPIICYQSTDWAFLCCALGLLPASTGEMLDPAYSGVKLEKISKHFLIKRSFQLFKSN